MQRAVCKTLWDGLPLPPVTIWDQPHGARGVFVLDGQQRLRALGCPFADDPAPCASHLDLETGRWEASPPHPFPTTAWALSRYSPEPFFRTARGTMPSDELDRIADLWCQANERIRLLSIFTFTISAEAGQAEAAEIFRRINTPGVQMTPEEVDALIASCA